ncbi:MAG: hypothetical protein OXF27_10410 [Acidobacteria bacterium]|nr:hypothetical protein [Acidobacteriota bacterium]
MMPPSRSIVFSTGAMALLALAGWGYAQTQTQPFRDVPVARTHGQSVTPAFEGWYPNPDGTFNLSWGYMNRNYEQRLDIPVGPDNRLEPGPADQGQPTHFLPRRQTGVFTVTVPADFGDRTLTWTVTAHGETMAVPGHLRPEWQIDALREVTTGNTPPVVRFEPEGPHAQGPRGVRAAAEAQASDSVPLAVWITDDLVLRSSGNYPLTREPRLGVLWSKFRGPGKVSFSNVEPALDPAGKAVTTATFDAPGEYVLRVLAWDDSGPQLATMAVGFQCCWTNGYVDVRVK